MKAIFLGVSVLIGAAPVAWASVTPVVPGDNGSIEWTISNATDSVSPMAGVSVVAELPPGFSRAQTSVLGPFTIASGQSKTFRVDYLVGESAPTGESNIILRVAGGDPRAVPRPAGVVRIERFKVTRDEFPPRVSVDSLRSSAIVNDSGSSNALIRVIASDDLGVQKVEVFLADASYNATAVVASAIAGGAAHFETEFSIPATESRTRYVLVATDINGRTSTAGAANGFDLEAVDGGPIGRVRSPEDSEPEGPIFDNKGGNGVVLGQITRAGAIEGAGVQGVLDDIVSPGPPFSGQPVKVADFVLEGGESDGLGASQYRTVMTGKIDYDISQGFARVSIKGTAIGGLQFGKRYLRSRLTMTPTNAKIPWTTSSCAFNGRIGDPVDPNSCDGSVHYLYFNSFTPTAFGADVDGRRAVLYTNLPTIRNNGASALEISNDFNITIESITASIPFVPGGWVVTSHFVPSNVPGYNLSPEGRALSVTTTASLFDKFLLRTGAVAFTEPPTVFNGGTILASNPSPLGGYDSVVAFEGSGVIGTFGAGAPVDVLPPAVVQPTVTATDAKAIHVEFTSVGGSGQKGNAAYYEVSIKSGVSVVWSDVISAATRGTAQSFTTDTLPAGIYSVEITAVDLAGNRSAASVNAINVRERLTSGGVLMDAGQPAALTQMQGGEFHSEVMIGALRANRLKPAGPTQDFTAGDGNLIAPVELHFPYSLADIAANNIPESALSVYALDLRHGLSRPAQVLDTVNKQIMVTPSNGNMLFSMAGPSGDAEDRAPPQTSFEVWGASGTDAQGHLVISSDTFVFFLAQDHNANASGVTESRYLIDSVFLDTRTTPGTLFEGTFTLPTGTHTLVYFSIDSAGNVENPKQQYFSVLPPPQTTLVIGTPSFSGATVFVSSTTPLRFAVGGGMAGTFLSIDTAPFAAVSDGFRLAAEGTHAIQFYSMDLTGAVEPLHVSLISVDITAPVSLLQFVGGGSTDAKEMLVISTGTLLGFTATDPLSSGVAAGVKQILVAVDGGTLTGYETPFALSPGFHTIRYFAVDNLNNAETLRTIQLSVGPPPITSVDFVAKSTIGANAQSVAVDSSNNVYVNVGTRIVKLSPEGQLLTSWGTAGSGPGQIRTADGMRIGPDGNLYVSDWNSVVHIFSPSGAFLADISGGFTTPVDVAFDSKGQLNILDIRAGLIFRTKLDGTPIATIPVVPGSFGGLAIDPQDNMYVANFTTRRVEQYTAAGQQLLSFGGETGVTALNRPRRLEIDLAGRVHVADWFGNRIVVYSSTAAFIGEYGTPNSNPNGVLTSPTGIAILKSGTRVWISPQGPGIEAVFQYDLQTAPPSAPMIASPTGNVRVYGATPMVVGRAKAGMKVTLFDAGLVAATTTVLDSSGMFAVRIPLSVGPHHITAHAITNMGFSSPLSIGIDFTVAVGPPTFSFGPPAPARIPAPPSDGITSLTTVNADFNGDGNPDLFVLGYGGYAVFLGDGKGSFNKLPAVAFPGVGNFGRTTRAYAADLNKDGKMDVVVLDAAPLLRVMQGNGNGTFGDGTYQSVVYISQGFPSGYAPWDFCIGDLNNDGNMDIITTDGRNLGVLLGRGDPGFTFASQPLVPTGLSPFTSSNHTLTTADFNSDGKLDVVMEGIVYFGDARGGFSNSTVLCSACRFPLVGDYNQDGNPDIALFSNSGVNTFVGLRDGTFKVLPPQSGSAGPLGVTRPVSDLNGDGLPDLSYGSSSGDITLFPGRGDGLFGTPQTIRIGSSCSYIETISAADFNKDGAIDLASALNFNTGCSLDEVSFLFNRAVPPDNVPPAAVTNLASQSNQDGTVSLIWTAPGDNGGTGQAAVYDMRVATTPITTLALFNSAARLSGVSTPLVAGFSEGFVVAGLSGGTTFFFALRTTDRAGNASALSNNSSVKTLFVIRSVAAINGQPEFSFVNASLQPLMTVIGSTSAAGTLILGSATAQGLTLVSQIYELQPEGAVFSPPASLTMRYSTATLAGLGVLEQDLGLHRFDAGQGWIRIPGQTLDTQNRLITVPISAIMSIYAVGGIVRDLTPPKTIVITATGSRFIDSIGTLYGSSSTTFSFSAFDPTAFGTASGVAFTQFRVDATTPTGPFSLFTTSYILMEGKHLVEFHSQDAAGNLELTRSSQIFIDGTAPQTSLIVNGSRAPGSSSMTLVVSSVTSFGFQSIDPIINGAASGVAKISFRIDGGTLSVFNVPFTLKPGPHFIDFDAVDAVGNVEAVQRASIVVDTRTPNVILNSPSGGERFVASVATITIQFVVTDTLDPLPTFYATLVEQQDRGSPRGSRPAVVAVSSGQVLLPLDLDDGLWFLRILATNSILNSTVVVSVPFEIVHDTVQPRTTLAIGTPQTSGGPDGALFVTGQTLLTLSSIDDLVASNDTLGLGTAFQEVSIDSLLRMHFQNPNPAQGQVFSSSFTLSADSDGLHVVTFAAQDLLQHQEVIRRTTVAVDNTPPITQLIMSAPNFGAYVATRTVVTLSAVDTIINGVASGVAFTHYQDNGGTFSASTAPLQLAEGAHILVFQSADALGNLEVLRSTNVLVDATPPVTTAAIGLPAFSAANGLIYVTAATPVIFSAVDPASGSTTAGSGVARVEVAIDGGPYTAYVMPLTFAEGPHTVSYRAVDNVGNVEPARALILRSDATPPLSALNASGAFFAANGRDYAPPSLTYMFSAADPVVNAVASDVASTRYRTGKVGPFAIYTSTFSLAEGVHRVEFQSQDNVGNLELLKSATVFVDATSPVAALAIGNPKFNPGSGRPVFVAAATPLTLSALDPEVREVASGVRQISFRSGTDALAPYVAPFALATPDGLKTVSFFAADNVDNTEAIRSTTLALDNTAPVTSLAILGGRQFAGPDAASFYASSDTRFILPAADPLLGGVASGLALTQFQDNGGAFQVFASAFGLPEGVHPLAYQSRDNVQNLEVLRSTTVLVDASAPVSSATVASPRFIAADGTIYITPATPVTLSAVDPSLPTGQPGSGASRIEVAIDGGNFSAYSSALTFAEGQHTILYRSMDNVANEAIRTLNVQSDATPPLTELAVIGGKQASSPLGDTFYASLDTRYALTTADPVVNGVASGVALTRYQDNGGSFTTFASPFSLAEGGHALGYQSQDKVQNLEVLRSTTVLVDATAPVSSATIGTPLFVGVDGTRYIMPATPVALSAFDPAISGVASGVERVEVAIDGGAFAAYASTLTFPEGRHTVLFRALDRVGNVEATHRLELQSDNTPPVTAFTPSGALFTAGERSYAPAQLTYALPAQDPVTGNVASGVAFTRYRTIQGAYQNFAAAFSLSEGIRRVEFQSQDNVGNLELLKSATVFVDATSPVSAFAIGNPNFDPGNGRPVFVAAATPLTLSAVDPEIQEVASGVRQISFHQGRTPFGAYSAPFTLPLPDGLKTVDYFAADNVGNAEVARSTSVALDDTAPATSLTVLGGRQFPGPNATSFYASSDTRLALLAVDPLVGDVASGLALTQWQDNGGAFQAFTAAFALPEGAHVLAYQSQDRVQNMEVSRSTTVLVDATPPVTTAHIGAPSFVSVDGTNYITPATAVTFTAVDPTFEGVASGVGRIEAAVDGGPFISYSSALSFAAGRHTILYRAIDNVANDEEVRTINVQSDAAPPASSLAIGAPSFDPGAGQPVIVAAATLLTLSAQDPVVLNVASGVRAISFRRGGEPFGTYAAPFTLQLPDGLKTLDYFATDNVGNQEATRSTAVALDNTPPLTMLAVLGGRQFLGPDAASFYASPDTRLALPAADPVVNGVASGLGFTQWQDNSGALQAFAIAFGLPEGRHLIAYQSQDRVLNMEVLRSTTVLVDATAPVSSATIGSPFFAAADGTNYITPATPVRLSAVDPSLPTGQPGSGVSRIEVAIDGGPFTIYSTALTFAEGRHTIAYRAIDNVANVETLRTLQVRSDATPPASSLVVGQPQFQLPTGLLVSTRTPFEVAAGDPISNDAASGVKDTFYRVSDLAPGAAAFSAFTAPFTMAGADVNKVIEFYSRDNVLNTEATKSSTVLLDSTPPEVALLSPASCDSGICRVLKGRFPVLGTAKDRHFQSYALEFAPGKDASAGFAVISSGTVAVSSAALGVWDASALSGWQTLRLSASDLVQNTAVLTLNVFVGDPATVLVLGGHDTFNMPEGVAVGGDGTIYVADRNNNRVAVFSSSGAALASFGESVGDDEDDDHPRFSTPTLRLKQPSAIAVDATGSVFVADTGNHRVLKLSSAGQVLLDIGRRKIEREDDDEKAASKIEFKAGAGPGEFKKPSGIAVDAAGRIYVSDTDNHRVQVFSSTGGFALAFLLPQLPRTPEDDDEDKKEDDDDRPELGKPAGIALDSAANIYVADPKGRRALAFDATGRLLMTVPISGRKPGSGGSPVGIAVSPSGDCLLVSDHKSGRILKYDFQGNLNLTFGGKGGEDDEDGGRRSVSSIKLRKPSGLAMDASGALYVADRNNERIKKFSLPDGSATVFAPAQRPDEDDNVAREVIDREEGGQVVRKDRAAVSIPADALPEDLKVSVTSPTATVAAESRRGADDKNMKLASQPVEYQPHGTRFEKPVTLILPYNPDLLAAQNAGDADLKVHYWNPGKKAWEELDSTTDKQSRTVRAKTTHFSLYQVFTGTSAPAALAPLAADPSFGVKAAYAFPNPARGVGTATIRIQPGLADSVTVRIYDVSGRKVHESSNFSNRGAFDDGNGTGPQFTYDHIWDVSGVGSGVYTFVMTAVKSGERDIHKTGKVGIIK